MSEEALYLVGDEIRVKTEASGTAELGELELSALRKVFLKRIRELQGRSSTNEGENVVEKLTDSSLEMIDLARRRYVERRHFGRGDGESKIAWVCQRFLLLIGCTAPLRFVTGSPFMRYGGMAGRAVEAWLHTKAGVQHVARETAKVLDRYEREEQEYVYY